MTLERFCSYIDENKGCPITEKFMKDGYMQGMVNGKIEKYSGYVRTARNRGFIQEDTKMITDIIQRIFIHAISSNINSFSRFHLKKSPNPHKTLIKPFMCTPFTICFYEKF